MHNQRGFTVLELVVAIMVGAALTTIAIRSLAGVQERFAVRQATNVFAAMHARARAQAVEFGEQVRLEIDVVGDSVWLTRDGATLDVIRFANEMDVDLQGGSNTYTLCLNSRGFADESCNSFVSSVEVSIVRNTRADTLKLLPLGQLIY